jgi:hypothetical protein
MSMTPGLKNRREAGAGSDDLPSGRERNAIRRVRESRLERRDHDSAGGEARVESAVRRVARDDEIRRVGVIRAMFPRRARDHDLSIRLENDPESGRVDPEVGQDLAAFAERPIEAPIRLVARQGNVAACEPGGNDLAVALEGHAVRGARQRPEVGRDLASEPEGGSSAPLFAYRARAKWSEPVPRSQLSPTATILPSG